MTILQKGKNKWYCEFMINGKRYHRACKGATSYKEAQQFENILRSEIMRGNLGIVERKNNHTLQQAIDLYLQYSKLHKRSYQNDINSTKIFINFWGKNHRLEEITPKSIEEFLQKHPEFSEETPAWKNR